jgi:uncharacterized protein YqgC (DUF456 family)
MSWLPLLYFVLAAGLIVLGVIGSIVPVLPGVPLVFAGMWLAAWADHYAHIGAGILSVLGLLCVAALVIDGVAQLIGAKRVGASAWALWGAACGALLGLSLGLPGLLLGPFLGALIGELVHGSQINKALGVGIGTLLGLIFGSLVKLALCFTMLGIFLLSFVLN